MLLNKLVVGKINSSFHPPNEQQQLCTVALPRHAFIPDRLPVHLRFHKDLMGTAHMISEDAHSAFHRGGVGWGAIMERVEGLTSSRVVISMANSCFPWGLE